MVLIVSANGFVLLMKFANAKRYKLSVSNEKETRDKWYIPLEQCETTMKIVPSEKKYFAHYPYTLRKWFFSIKKKPNEKYALLEDCFRMIRITEISVLSLSPYESFFFLFLTFSISSLFLCVHFVSYLHSPNRRIKIGLC